MCMLLFTWLERFKIVLLSVQALNDINWPDSPLGLVLLGRRISAIFQLSLEVM